MEEDPIIIRMNIAHYTAILKLNMAEEVRLPLERLLAKARENLVRVSTGQTAIVRKV